MPFDTYIEDRAMIPVLLGFDWIVVRNTWTDCPYETYMHLKKRVIHIQSWSSSIGIIPLSSMYVGNW